MTTAPASRGSIAERSSGGRRRRCRLRCSPSTSRLAAATAAGRPVWVSSATRRRRDGRCAAAAGSVTGPAYSPLARSEQHEELLLPALPGSRLGAPPALRQPVDARPPRRPRVPPADEARSRTTPPFSSRSRPTSNCGLTSSSSRPSAAVTAEQRPDQQGERDERHVGHHQVDRLGVQRGPGSGRAGWSAPTTGPAGRLAAAAAS